MSNSSDAILALNALLSASTNAIPAADAATSASNSGDSLTSLLDTLANFSARVNTVAGDSGGSSETSANSSMDIASLFFAGLANAKTELEPSTTDEYERFDREREQKFRDLEARFSFLNPRKPKIEQKEPQQASTSPSAPRMPTDREALAAAGKAFATSAMAELLSGLQRSQMEKNAAVSSTSTQKMPAQKRRARSPSSSVSSTESSTESSYSSSDSDRSGKGKKRKIDRKKKPKRTKTKKDKQKNGKTTSAAKHAKTKKDLLESERKAVAEHVSKLKVDLADYDKRRRTLEEELNRLKKQHNEMCRKLQRQKSDPRKDTLITENEALQADIERHLKEAEKQMEKDEKLLETEEKHLEKLKKQAKAAKREDASPKKSTATPEAPMPAKKSKNDNVEYVDPASYWCKHCGVALTNVYEWLEHLHSQKHKSNMDTLDRPWMPEQLKAPLKKEYVAVKPFKGAEFLIPATAFYCGLCKEFSGDSMSAEVHLKSSCHNEKYQAYVDTNPFYERREHLEKAAAVSHRLEKSASSADDKKAYHRSSTDTGPKTVSSRAPESQRVPHKPNESGKIKPFQLSSSTPSTSKDDKRTSLGFPMKLADPKKPTSSTSSSSTLKKPHSAFTDGGDRSKHESTSHRSAERSSHRSAESSSRHSDSRKRHYVR